MATPPNADMMTHPMMPHASPTRAHRLSHSCPALLPFHLRPAIPKRHRAIEHETPGLRVHRVTDEVSRSLELVPCTDRVTRDTRLDLSIGDNNQRVGVEC